jgi:hypothetical protein
MKEPYPRRVAIALLCLGIRMAPPELADWGQAMLNEMHHVEGNWSALLWSLGGTGVLAKHALLALIFPSRPAIASSGELFAREGPMQKMTLAITGACAVASLLFFLVPAYRQAIRVSLDPLYCAMDGDCGHRVRAELKAIARQAEQKHDAEGIGFVAVRLWGDMPESARLAEEAVHLDPRLTWLYAIVPGQFSSDSQTDRWARELQEYDPQNALPYLVIAAKINRDLFNARRIAPRVQGEPPAWQNAMAAAFQSPKFDNYCSQFKALEHRVLLRYSFDDAGRLRCRGIWGWGGDTAEYAASVLEAGEALEARDDRKAAREKYLAVARFGRMFGSGPGRLICASEVPATRSASPWTADPHSRGLWVHWVVALKCDLIRNLQTIRGSPPTFHSHG